MKVITKPNKIEIYDAIKVTKNMIGKVLTDTPIVKQTIVEENGKLMIREHNIDNTNKYNSTSDIDVFLEEGDLLVKVEKGYTKPIANFIILDKTTERAINKINKIK